MVPTIMCCAYQRALTSEHRLISGGLEPFPVETCIFANGNEIMTVGTFHV